VGWMMGSWGWGGCGGWAMWLGLLASWLFLGGLAVLVYVLVTRAGASRAALDELQLRYVRGEIGKEEYETLRRELR
jgi:uncharacterized membrane protein